jgi:tartrate-resistant acid phosphatase type 5
MRGRVSLLLVRACLLCALAVSTGCSRGVSTEPAREPSSILGGPAGSGASAGTSLPVTFAVIGDYGNGSPHERAVADLVDSWDPAYVIALGDDYYAGAGGTGTGKYDRSTGAFYGRWLKDITTTGKLYPLGTARVNAFFPAMGNHDLSDATPSPRTYLTYFNLPGSGFANTSGNERYYDFVQGPVHFFVLNSNKSEPDGTSSDSKQGKWLQRGLAASTAKWNIVYFHHPPYSSYGGHGSAKYMQWPFASWGADGVLSGHAHDYERVMHDGIPYFVNGLGGATRHDFSPAVAGSAVRYRDDWGAQKVTITDSEMTFEFYAVSGRLVDICILPAVAK